MSVKIAFFDAKDYDKASFSSVQNDFDFEFLFFETRLNEETAKLSTGCDAVCVFVNDEVNKKVIDTLVGLDVKLIALRCSGYNNVDYEYARDKITIIRVPSYSQYSVAEHAMALLLTLVRKTHKAYIRTRDFNFSLKNLTGFDLHNKTIGVVGTGKIGRAFINICKGFGMHVIAYDPYPDSYADFDYVSLDVLFKDADIVSLFCPLTDESAHMINVNTVSLMKKGVIIVNTSRGALIDSKALLDGLKSGRIKGACLDVYEEEADFFFMDYSYRIMPDDTLSRLISLPNVIVTSHQAYLTDDALMEISQETLRNIGDYFEKGYCESDAVVC